MANDPATLVVELERLYQRQADLRAYEIDLAERGENDPASDTWKTAAIVAASAEVDFQSALVRNYSTISRVLREAAEGWRPIETAPKDGREVLLYSLAWRETWGECRPGFFEGDGEGGGTWTTPGGPTDDDEPTHWRPLPAPPTEAATQSLETSHD